MSPTDFIVNSIILDYNELTGKTDVVRQFRLRLAADGYLDLSTVPSDYDAIMRREPLGSTGIGEGIAIPHARHSAFNRRLGILGLCRPLIDFTSFAEMTN